MYEKTFPPCRLCESAPANCKSHIIPRKFFRRIQKDAKYLLGIYAPKRGEVKKIKKQAGYYEQGILCPPCDGKIGKYDEYGYDVLKEKPDETRMHSIGEDGVYLVGDVDAHKFRIFLISLTWRMHLSKDPFFNRVNLGPIYEKAFKDILQNPTIVLDGRVDSILVLMRMQEFSDSMWPPFNAKLEGINVIYVYLPPWKAIIKIDKRPFTSEFRKLRLGGDSKTLAIIQSRFWPGEVQVIEGIKKRMRENKSLD